MSHLDYYKYQAIARGALTAADVVRLCRQQSYVWEQLINRWLPANPSARMVDLACGHGSFLYWLKEKKYQEIAGVDSSQEQIDRARSAGISVVKAEVIDWLLGQPAGSADVLFAIDFIEHITKDDFMRFLALTHAVLKPGGRLILRYPNGDSPFVGLNLFNDITHVWTYTTNCLNTLARMHRFSGVEFADEGVEAIRDNRRLKVPVGRVARSLLRALVQAATRERVSYWHSSIWACLAK